MKIIVKKRLFWYYIVASSNGQVLSTSETYFSKGNARRAASKLAKALKVEIDEQ